MHRVAIVAYPGAVNTNYSEINEGGVYSGKYNWSCETAI